MRDENRQTNWQVVLSEQLKQALKEEAIYYKSQGVFERDSINKNMIFIIEQFIKKHQDDQQAVASKFAKIIPEDTKGMSACSLDVLKIYPLKITYDLLDRFNKLRIEVGNHLGAKINKINFYQFILFDYYANIFTNKEVHI